MRLGITLLALASPLAVLGDLRHSHRRASAHSDIAKRAEGHIQLHKRFSGTRWTFYDVGGAAGACGDVNSPDQYIVALNSAQYGGGYPGPNCFKKIVMQIGDKQTTATITDECPGCPYGGLDLTRGLFQFFAPLGTGVLSGNWWFEDQAPSTPTPYSAPKPAATTTAKPKPTPTTTFKPKPTTTTTVKPQPTPTLMSEAIKVATPKTSSTSSTSSTSVERTTSSSSPSSSSHSLSSSTHSSSAVSSSALSSVLSSSVTSGLAAPTPVVNTDKGENILSCNQALIDFGALAAAAAEV